MSPVHLSASALSLIIGHNSDNLLTRWEFLIYWLQAKQRVTAVFSNQRKDLWCLQSVRPHLAGATFVAPLIKGFIFVWFPPDLRPPVLNLLCVDWWWVLLIQIFTFLASLFSCFKSKYFWAISTCWVGCPGPASSPNHASLASEGRQSLPGAYLALPEFRWVGTIFKNNCTLHSLQPDLGTLRWHRNSQLSHHVF